MSSQRGRSSQGSLPSHALHVLERPLRHQFELGLGTGLLPGICGGRATRPITNGGGEIVTGRNWRIRVSAASAEAGAGTLRTRSSEKLRRDFPKRDGTLLSSAA